MKKAILISLSAAAALSVLGGILYARTAGACPMMSRETAAQMSGPPMAHHQMAGMTCPMSDQCPMMAANSAASATPHSGTASIRSIDPAQGTVSLAHGPIASINWPAMTMEFKLKDKTLAEGLRAGDLVAFQFIRSGRDYVVTDIRVAGK